MTLEKDIKLGEVGDFEVKLEQGKVQLTVKVEVPQAAMKAGVTLELDGSMLLDKLAAAVPGKIDDAVIALVKAALVSA